VLRRSGGRSHPGSHLLRDRLNGRHLSVAALRLLRFRQIEGAAAPPGPALLPGQGHLRAVLDAPVDLTARVMPGPEAGRDLPRMGRVLAVCAHPDDESFGLGAVLAALAEVGTSTGVLCFAYGEASTLGRGAGNLRLVRAGELAAAALETEGARLLDYPDGRLADVSVYELAGHVLDQVQLTRTVIAWAIPQRLAEVLNAEFGSAFAGRPPDQIDLTITVRRASQIRAIRCHASQSAANPVLWRRLELLGDAEHLRYLR
jgi:N-acetylglucosamine malate deacetylase 2